MKAPRFWYPPRDDFPGDIEQTTAWLLWPLSLLFRLGGWTRRRLASPYRPRVPLICVGNAVVGGAGKTPVALALARRLRDKGHKPVFITRGYGGSGKVARVDPARHSAADVGDEALLLAACAPTWAGRDRAEAARQAESSATVIIMDDGLQNPHLVPTLSILVADGETGIGNGFVLPAGPLRESFAKALRRAAALIVIGGHDRHRLAAQKNTPAFRARLQPAPAKPLPRGKPFLAFAGIARPEKFYATARAAGIDLIETRDFPDHHVFTQHELDTLRARAEKLKARLLTTEKDAVRLPPAFRATVSALPVVLTFDDPAAENILADLCERTIADKAN